jgi:Sigma-70 region 2
MRRLGIRDNDGVGEGDHSAAKDEALLELIRSGSDKQSEARAELIRRYTPIVSAVAETQSGVKRGSSLRPADLKEAGLGGLDRAIDEWRPGKTRRFPTYATWCIRQNVQARTSSGRAPARAHGSSVAAPSRRCAHPSRRAPPGHPRAACRATSNRASPRSRAHGRPPSPSDRHAARPTRSRSSAAPSTTGTSVARSTHLSLRSSGHPGRTAGQRLRRYAPPGLPGILTQEPVNAGPGSGAIPSMLRLILASRGGAHARPCSSTDRCAFRTGLAGGIRSGRCWLMVGGGSAGSVDVLGVGRE